MAWALCLALSASAHDLYPIRPVHASLRVEADRIVVDLRADSIIWIEEVTGLHPMPARDWPRDTLAKVEAYANDHFRLTEDGRPLPGRLVDAYYRQFPWEVNEEGVFFLRLEYPAPSKPGATLGGTARFYEEHLQEIKTEYAGRPLPPQEGYITFVTVPGRRNRSFTLTLDAPAFAVSVDEARRTTLAMAFEALRRGAEAALGTAAAFPAVIAVVLCLGARPLTRRVLLIESAALAFGFIAGAIRGAEPRLIWAATLAAALSQGRTTAFAFVAVAALGFTWCHAARPYLPHSDFAWPSAFAGVLLAGAALQLAAWLGARAEHRRLAAVSESRVDELFARRARLTATALALVGAYGLWLSIPR